MDKKKLKSSFDIGAASSTLHVMNENVRKKTPIYSNRINTKLAISWPRILAPNANAYDKKKCAKNKTRFQKSKQKTPNQSTITSYFTNSSSSSSSSTTTPNSEAIPSVMHSYSGDEFLSENEMFDPKFINSLIPPNAPLVSLNYVAIPFMMKSGNRNHITKMDIAQIKDRVECQIHVLIYKPYIHGKITLS